PWTGAPSQPARSTGGERQASRGRRPTPERGGGGRTITPPIQIPASVVATRGFAPGSTAGAPIDRAGGADGAAARTKASDTSTADDGARLKPWNAMRHAGATKRTARTIAAHAPAAARAARDGGGEHAVAQSSRSRAHQRRPGERGEHDQRHLDGAFDEQAHRCPSFLAFATSWAMRSSSSSVRRALSPPRTAATTFS